MWVILHIPTGEYFKWSRSQISIEFKTKRQASEYLAYFIEHGNFISDFISDKVFDCFINLIEIEIVKLPTTKRSNNGKVKK